MNRALAVAVVGALLMGSTATAAAEEISFTPGVSVVADADSPTGYTATFVYQSNSAEAVVLYSDTFYRWDEAAPAFTGDSGLNLNQVSEQDLAAYGHLPSDYAESYWTGGGSGSSRLSIPLEPVAGTDFWMTSLPLSSGAYVYNYMITTDGQTTARLDDPANPALVNTATGVRSLSSMVYVPYDAAKQGSGPYKDRSVELPRTDGRTGTVQTITYPSQAGEQRGMSVYLPYGYDPHRGEPYKVLYINMGNSGDQFGNELRWMNEGALPNIVDNLVAEGSTEPFIAVSMNYQDWQHDFSRIEPDVLNNVIPFVEANYNVSQERSGRAYAGLSMGAATTSKFYLNDPEVFSSYGIWSNGVIPTAEQLAEVSQWADQTDVHIALARWDFVTAGRDMSEIFSDNGIQHRFTEIPGGHDWEFWQLMLAEFIENTLWKTRPVDTVVESSAGPVLTPDESREVASRSKPAQLPKTGI